ncbi:MAG: hypothetical protein LQ338_004860 [Usnochroma carphineum]|nr:MAG: hypothetical protein LQ338_004860 [Usnochroma carphineum]
MSGPEILVHAAAPSRGSDDARYRKEALGILDFACVKRHVILPEQTQDKQKIGQAAEETPTSTSHDAPPAVAQESVTSTDPAPRKHLTHAFVTWTTPTPTLTRPTPKVLIDRTPAPSFHDRTAISTSDIPIKPTPADQYRPRTAPPDPSAIQETPNVRPALSDSFETPPSVIPDSQPTPPSQKNGKRPFDESSSPSPTHQSSPIAKRRKSDGREEFEVWTQPEDTSTPPLLNGAPQSFPTTTTNNNKNNAGSASSSSPPPPDENHTTQVQPHRCRRRQLFPPPPTPSTKPFTTHLTHTLTLLQKTCPTFIQAVRARRPIAALERGHWRFGIPDVGGAWDEAAREKMWGYLEKVILGGQAGWGVWAVFEEGGGDGDGDWDKGELGGVRSDGDAGLGSGNARVKVYCWGEVVAEVYALLVLATSRKVKRCGPQWIDAAGEVVVDMDLGGAS